MSLQMSSRALILVMAACCAPISGHATAGSNDERPDITVEARRVGRHDPLINSLAPSRGGRQLARWEFDICPRVVGLPTERATFIEQRIRAVAREVRLPVGESGRCVPNVVAVFTSTPDELVLNLRRQYPELFGVRDEGDWRNSKVAAYLEPRPVRWLGCEETVADNGLPPSRIRSRVRQRLTLAYIIVDVDRLQQITWGQLADYLSLVALARPQFAAIYDDPRSILSLFIARTDGLQGPSGLTDYDWSFLHALYRTENRQSADSQRRAIVRDMKRSGR